MVDQNGTSAPSMSSGTDDTSATVANSPEGEDETSQNEAKFKGAEESRGTCVKSSGNYDEGAPTS